eukprot:scaffold27503_cov23-Tisochrysis_lutea.AAC.3
MASTVSLWKKSMRKVRNCTAGAAGRRRGSSGAQRATHCEGGDSVGARARHHRLRLDRRSDPSLDKGGHRVEALDAKLVHVKQLVIKGSSKDEVVRPLLGVRAKSKQACVVLLAQKLERRRVFPRVDCVVPREVESSRLLQHVEVSEEGVDERGRFLAASEKCRPRNERGREGGERKGSGGRGRGVIIEWGCSIY